MGTLLSSLKRFSLAAVCVLSVPFLSANIEDAESYTNSLGMQFVQVEKTPILVGVYETTIGQFNAFLEATKYQWQNDLHFEQDAQHPVVNIILEDAMAFCRWLTEKEVQEGRLKNGESYRLPTNLEWDQMVGIDRFGESSNSGNALLIEKSYPWGTNWPPLPAAGNFAAHEIEGYDDQYPFTSPVGSFNANSYGLYDLAGNAWEWTMDAVSGQSPKQGTLRGGSWIYFRKEYLKSAFRYSVSKELKAPTFGFRCVLESRQRTASFLKNKKELLDKTLSEKSTALTGKGVEDDKQLQEAKMRLLSQGGAVGDQVIVPDVNTLKEFKLGSPYTNHMGTVMLPVSGLKLQAATTEVSKGEYEFYLKEASVSSTAKSPTFKQSHKDPVVQVNWFEAVEYCKWMTLRERGLGLISDYHEYRLPTDAEWSVMAGLGNEAGQGPQEKSLVNRTVFPWGSAWPVPILSGNFDSNNIKFYQDRYPYTAPVGVFKSNRLGLFDLGGNVSEWTQDAWGTEEERVVRGSSWMHATREELLASARWHFDPSRRRQDLGFRVVLGIVE